MIPEAFGVGTIVVIKKKNLPLLQWKLSRRCGDVFEKEWRDMCSVNMTSMVSSSKGYIEFRFMHSTNGDRAHIYMYYAKILIINIHYY